MFLHIGNGETVSSEDIIGIFDLDTATVSHTTREYLSAAQKKKRVKDPTDRDIPKSFILIKKGGETEIRLLRISTAALRARLHSYQIIKSKDR